MTSTNATTPSPTTRVAYSPFEMAVIDRLIAIEAKQDEMNEKLEAIEVRLSDMDLDTGGGFEIDS